jgi:hypothetical protein
MTDSASFLVLKGAADYRLGLPLVYCHVGAGRVANPCLGASGQNVADTPTPIFGADVAEMV